MNNQYNPTWVSPPGATIKDVMEERGIAPDALASGLGLTRSQLQDLLDGRYTISDSLAESLSEVIGAPSDFWRRREATYRKRLACQGAK